MVYIRYIKVNRIGSFFMSSHWIGWVHQFIDPMHAPSCNKEGNVYPLDSQICPKMISSKFRYYAKATKFEKNLPLKIWHYWTIYSATTFLERCKKVVWEIWFEKSGLRNLVQEIWFEKSGWPEKKNLSLQNHFSKTTFLHFSRKVVAE